MDQKALDQSLALFKGFRNNLPSIVSDVSEADVKHYNAIVELIDIATEESLNVFKIDDNNLVPNAYSKGRHCDSHHFRRQVDAFSNYLETYLAALKTSGAKPADRDVSKPAAHQTILVLISHSSEDKALAEALIELLRSALGLLASQIRCSSVDGYRLPAGVNTNEELRNEINSVAVLIGLLTPNSIASIYVLFDLGARWGAGRFMVPLLAGIDAEQMRGPDRVLNALSCQSETQLIQLVEDLGKELRVQVQSTASYLKQARAVVSLSTNI